MHACVYLTIFSLFQGKKDDRSKKDNEKFYKNKLKSYPDGKRTYIDISLAQ